MLLKGIQNFMQMLFSVKNVRESKALNKDALLIQKADQLHSMLLMLELVISLLFSSYNYSIGSYFEMKLSLIPVPFVFFCILLNRKGYITLSKVVNTIQITSVLVMLTMHASPATGVVAFFAPAILGCQIAFQGRERVLSYVMTAYTILVMLFALLTDYHLGPPPLISPDELKIEWVLNYSGAALATIMAIVFIVRQSNVIQDSLLATNSVVASKNEELERTLNENRLYSEKIEEQLRSLRIADQELMKLALIATKTKSGVLVADGEARVEWVNNVFSNMMGYELSEIRGVALQELFQKAADKKAFFNNLIHELRKEQGNIEMELLCHTRTGHKLTAQMEIAPVFDSSDILLNIIILLKDVTEVRKSQEEVLRINNRFDVISRHSGIGIWEWDAITNNVSWNETLFRQFEVSPEEIGQELYTFWKSRLNPDDLKLYETEVNKLIAEQGTVALEQVIRIRRVKDGKERYMKSLTVAEKTPENKLLRLIGSSIDITDTLELENSMQQQNRALAKANKELDYFVYSVSHDLRSPLLSVKGLLALAFESGKLDEALQNYLRMADMSINRLDETIKEILEYSRNARLDVESEKFHLNELIRLTFDDLRYMVGPDFSFILENTEEFSVHSDRTRIHTLLRNLIGNAVKYRNKDIGNPEVRVRFSRAHEINQIEISDNGEGIPEAELPRIFEMFYRATSSSPGTGLGLYICREVLDRINGTIQISSQLGHGTTVVITFPEMK